jgi:hypothetical protein
MQAISPKCIYWTHNVWTRMHILQREFVPNQVEDPFNQDICMSTKMITYIKSRGVNNSSIIKTNQLFVRKTEVTLRSK